MGESFERPDADNAVASSSFYIHHNYEGTGEEDENDDDADKADIKFVFTELGVQNCNFDVTACAGWITLTKEW